MDVEVNKPVSANPSTGTSLSTSPQTESLGATLNQTRKPFTVSATAHIGEDSSFPTSGERSLRFPHVEAVQTLIGSSPPILGFPFPMFKGNDQVVANPSNPNPMISNPGTSTSLPRDFRTAFSSPSASDPAARKRAIRLAQAANPNAMNLFTPVKPTTGIHATSFFPSQPTNRGNSGRSSTNRQTPQTSSEPTIGESTLTHETNHQNGTDTSSSDDKNNRSSSSEEIKADQEIKSEDPNIKTISKPLPSRALKKKQLGQSILLSRENSELGPSTAITTASFDLPTSSSGSKKNSHNVDDEASKVMDFMLLGGVNDAFDMEFLTKHNITTILNVSSEEYTVDGFPPGIKIKHVLMKDVLDFAIDKTFDQCFEVIDDVRKRYFEKVKTLDVIASERGIIVGGYPRFTDQKDRKDAQERGITPFTHREDTPNTLTNGETYPSTPMNNNVVGIIQHSPNVQRPPHSHPTSQVPSEPLIPLEEDLFPERMLIHCQKGRSRSATIVAAYLIRSNGWNVVDTLRYLTRCRHVVDPNVGFINRLGILQQSIEKHSRTEEHRKLMCCARSIHSSWSSSIRKIFTNSVGMVFAVSVPSFTSTLTSIVFVCHESVDRAVWLFKKHREDFARLELPKNRVPNGVEAETIEKGTLKIFAPKINGKV